MNEDIAKWLKNMGYHEELPENFAHLCSPSTTYIWHQLISKVKPKEEVQKIQKNLIINRLQRKPLKNQDEFDCQIKEIEAYSKKLEVLNSKEMLEENIREKNAKVEKLLELNTRNYILIDNAKQQIKENNEKAFILNKKVKMLEVDVRNADEMLELAKYLTPVEENEEADVDSNTISETLNKCVDRLEQLLAAQTNNTHNHSMSSTLGRSHICSSTKKHGWSRSLLASGKKTGKENSSFFMNNKKCNAIKEKRESLGLLPTSFMDSSLDELEDIFAPQISQNSILAMSECTKNQPVQYSGTDGLSESRREPPFRTLTDDPCVKKDVRNLLHTHSKALIMNVLSTMIKASYSDLNKAILNLDRIDDEQDLFWKENMMELYGVHVRNEIEKLKLRALTQELREHFYRRKEETYEKLLDKSFSQAPEDLRHKFELHLRNAELDCLHTCLKKEIASKSRKFEHGIKLSMITAKANHVMDKINAKTNFTEKFLEATNSFISSIKEARDETIFSINKLSDFIIDMSWADALNASHLSEEIDLFGRFPLEYNRKFIHTATGGYYRDCSTSTVPTCLDLDLNNLKMVSVLLDAPFKSPEQILLDLMELAAKLETLRAMDKPLNVPSCQEYSIATLKSREDYIHKAVEDINLQLRLSSKMTSSASKMKTMMELWLEMPFKNYISSKREVEGHDYKYYEEKYDNCYHRLQNIQE